MANWLGGLALLLCFTLSPAAWAQAPSAQLRIAGITEARLSEIEAAVAREARSRRVSERALLAAAQASGAELASSGSFDPEALAQTIIGQLETQAETIQELESRLSVLAQADDPNIARLINGARASIDEGRLADADTLLAQAEVSDLAGARAAAAQAEARFARAAETMAERGRIAFLQGNHLNAAGHYDRAAETAPGGLIDTRWRYRMGQANALLERGRLFNEPAPLREAVRVYEMLALPLAPRDARSADWAATQNGLGAALFVLGERGDDAALAAAVSAFERVRTSVTRERDGWSWALANNNIGNALQVLGQRGEGEALLGSVEAYENALTVMTRERDPNFWALVQTNLGSTFVRLYEQGDSAALPRALEAFANALTVLTRENDPVGWARISLNAGAAILRGSDAGASEALPLARAAFENALTVMTSERYPAGWALAQMNLGIVLVRLGRQGDDAAPALAIGAFEAALTILTRERDPVGWAMTQVNLGNAFALLGERGDDAALSKAVAAYEAALTELTRDRSPAHWASIQGNLGYARALEGDRADARGVDARAAYAAAIGHYRAALEGFETSPDGAGRERAQRNLADAEAKLARLR